MRKALFEGFELPDCETGQGDARTITRDFEFELITPMFGGDSESWVLNPKAPVRPQSVKGQLRFWWRTMQSEPDHSRLLKMENAVWGGETENGRIQSPVKIAVLKQTVAAVDRAELNEKGFAVKGDVIPTYVAFPVTNAIKNEGKEVYYVEQLAFTLRVSYPVELEETVMNTLKLWTLFGGVGARTRRGCGSLFCAEIMESFPDENAVFTFVRQFDDCCETLAYPRTHGARLAFAPSNADPASAWKELIDSYFRFRQDRLDRRPRNPIPGRSYWPEPDAIRILTGSKSKHHRPEHPDGVWFPRAAFGLPIITKFNTRGNGSDDPDPQADLQPAIGYGDRWPSPVILKVVRLSGENVLKTAIVLNHAFPENLVLKQGNEEISVPGSALPFAPAPGSKVMKTRPGANLGANETIYQALFRELDLEEVQ